MFTITAGEESCTLECLSKCASLHSFWFLQQLCVADVDRAVAQETVRSLDALSSFERRRELLDFIPGAHVLEKKQVKVNGVRGLSRMALCLVFLYLCDVEIYLDGRLRAAAGMERLGLQCYGSQQERQRHLRTKVSVSGTNRSSHFHKSKPSTWRAFMAMAPTPLLECA